jgi:hypothetical protein
MEEQKIDKEVFDAFFRENYCALDYADIKSDFEEIAERGLEELFIDSADISKITKKNFIVYMRGNVYGEFEDVIEEAFDSLNPEITDVVIDLSVSSEDAGEITTLYWNTCEDLLKAFLGTLYDRKISKMLEEC